MFFEIHSSNELFKQLTDKAKHLTDKALMIEDTDWFQQHNKSHVSAPLP